MRGRPRAGSVLRVGAAVVASAAVIYALVPFTVSARVLYTAVSASVFRTSVPDSESSGPPTSFDAALPIRPQGSCGPALIDAWRAKSPRSGWFGYAPLTSVPTLPFSLCRAESQRRLGHVGEALLAALALLFAARWIGRRPGWASGPTPSPAT